MKCVILAIIIIISVQAVLDANRTFSCSYVITNHMSCWLMNKLLIPLFCVMF